MNKIDKKELERKFKSIRENYPSRLSDLAFDEEYVQHVKELIEKNQDFLICGDCLKYPQDIEELMEVKELMTSSCDGFQFCSHCGDYGHFRNFKILKAVATIKEEEPCNCMEEHGSIQHNDGGNYHLTTWEIHKVIKIVSIWGR